MLGNKISDIVLNSIAEFFRSFCIFAEDCLKYGEVNEFGNTKLFLVAVNPLGNINHHIGEYFYVSFFCLNKNGRNSSVLDLCSSFLIYNIACFCKYVTCKLTYNIFG